MKIDEVEELKKACKDCTFIHPWMGYNMCGDCAVGNRLKYLRYKRKLKSEESEYEKLFNAVRSQFEFHPRILNNLVQITRKHYHIGGARETPLSALKRIKEALENEEYIT